MSFTCKNCNTSLITGHSAPARKTKPAPFAAVLLFTSIGIMGLASAGCGNQPSTSPVQVSPQPQVAQAAPNPSPANSSNASVPDLLHLASASTSPAASRPTGVLTFSGRATDSALHTDFFDYDIQTRKLTDFGEGEECYRAKNGTALIAVLHVQDTESDLVLVSAGGKRTTVKTDFSGLSGNFILSPDGTRVIYGTEEYGHDVSSNALVSTQALAIHNVQTGDEKLFRW